MLICSKLYSKSCDYLYKTALHSVQLPLNYIYFEIAKFSCSDTGFVRLSKYFIDLIMSWFLESCKRCFSFSYNLIGFYKQALKSGYWFYFSGASSFARKKMRFTTESGAIRNES